MSIHFLSRVSYCTMMMCRLLLFVGGVPLLASTKVPTEQSARAPSLGPKPLQSLVSECSASHYIYDEEDASCDTHEPTVPSPQPPIFTSNRAASRFSEEESGALVQLLLAIVGAELSECVLGIVWDSGFSGSVVVDRLSLLPNIKQVLMTHKKLA